jgi:hypothetical protein
MEGPFRHARLRGPFSVSGSVFCTVDQTLVVGFDSNNFQIK